MQLLSNGKLTTWQKKTALNLLSLQFKCTSVGHASPKERNAKQVKRSHWSVMCPALLKLNSWPIFFFQCSGAVSTLHWLTACFILWWVTAQIYLPNALVLPEWDRSSTPVLQRSWKWTVPDISTLHRQEQCTTGRRGSVVFQRIGSSGEYKLCAHP